MDSRNVIDRYKGWATDLIREDVQKNVFPYAVFMEHLNGDFNISSVIRSANAFGAEMVYYYGKKKWDRRGAVGTHNYTMVEYVNDFSVFEQYNPVVLEQCDGSVPINNFDWPDKPLIVVGEEGEGISSNIIQMCKYKVEIPQFGSVRSLNAGAAASIAMYDFVTKYKRKKDE